MRRLGGTLLAALFSVAMPAAAQEDHHHQATATAATAGTAAITAEAKATVAAPTFSPAPGTLTPPNNLVTLTSATAGATIYYTTNGTSPSRKTSPAFTAPIPITAATTIKAFAYKKGMTASAVVTGVYAYNNAPPPPPPPPSEAGGTLFVGTLTPQGSAVSGGSGSATLTLTQDQSAAFLRYSYANLTGPITSQHIHGPDGAILFDVDTATPQADGARLWTIGPVGTYSKQSILAALQGGELYLNLHTATYPAGEIKGFFRRSSGSQTFTPPPPPPALPGGPPTADDAARLLMQATYGARPGEVEALQQLPNLRAWLDQQMTTPRRSHLMKYDELEAQLPPDAQPNPGLVVESFVEQAVTAPDQLRQRVVFALSELFVISARDADVRNGPAGMASYLDLLGEHAFGNFRELLEAVTLHPSMGVYLDMAGSSRSLPEIGRNPNENYAREILQLFTIGLYQLHPDGTLKLDAQNQPIPTYDQEVVLALSRAFTGWTFGGQGSQINLSRFFRPQRNYRIPMEPWAFYHDTGAKVLLDGATLPAGQSARDDLEQALDVIFHHRNVGPFVCRALIQRLVTSNPSPAYVYRCGQVFADNGAGARGDMATVVRAILLDYEARATTIAARPDHGHLREPVVRLLGLLRAIDGVPRAGRWRLFGVGPNSAGSLGQVPLAAPTVFNFFEPTFALPGEVAQANLVSPEFQITSETTIVTAANFTQQLLGSGGRNGPLRFNLLPFQPPQVASDAALLDRVDLLLFGGAMSDGTRSILLTALADPDFPRTSPDARVLTLLWLASITPESVVQK